MGKTEYNDRTIINENIGWKNIRLQLSIKLHDPLFAYVGNGSYLLQNSIDAMYGINVEIDTSRGRLLPVLEISAVLHARSCKELHIGLEEPNVFELIFN